MRDEEKERKIVLISPRLIKMNMNESAMYLQCRKLREIGERVVGENIYAIIAQI